MTTIRWERYPLLAQQDHTRSWLQIQGNLGLAPNTVEAYGRALEGYLHFCQNQGIAPETASREQLVVLQKLVTEDHERGGPLLVQLMPPRQTR